MSETESPGGKLLSMEHIFKWKPLIHDESSCEINSEFEPQLKNEFNFNNFIILLIKSYVHSHNIDSALETLNELEIAANDFKKDENSANLFDKIKDAYYHMIFGSKSFLLVKGGKREEAAEVLEKVKIFEEMNDFNKAAIYAMKSAVYALYSVEDSQKAFASIDKAIKLDPKNGQWNFLKALYKRKLRRMINPFEAPSLLEKELFEKALEYDPKNVVFKLHLADVYREISSHAAKRQDMCSHFLPKDSSLHDNLQRNINKKLEQAAEYYKSAAEEFADCPYVILRSAEGLAKLPHSLNDIKLARKLAKKGLEKSPENVVGNMVMALIYENFDKNIKEAEKHLQKCQNQNVFEADMNMIRLLHSTRNEKFEALQALNLLLNKYKEKPRQAILYSQIVSYCLFIKDDISKACENTIKFFSLNAKSTAMEVHRSCFVRTDEPFSLINVLTDEVKFVVSHKRSEEVKESCEKFLQYMNFQNVPILKGFPQNFKQQILQGKILNPNLNLMRPSRKLGQVDTGTNRRDAKKDHTAKERRNLSMNKHSNSLDECSGGKRMNHLQRLTKPNESLPSLMDNLIVSPPPKPKGEKIEQKHEQEKPVMAVGNNLKLSEADDNSSSDSKEKKLINKIVKALKKEKAHDNKSKIEDNELSETVIRKLLKKINLEDEKSSRRKKYHSDSEDGDLDRKRRKNRNRRDRSRRRYKSESDSDDSARYSRHHRRHKRHSSTDSESSSRSVRRKSHKKDRYDRDSNSRNKKRSDRNHSSDEVDRRKKFNHRSSHRDKRRDSVSSRITDDRSPSYDRGHRKRSPTKEKFSHRREQRSPGDNSSSRGISLSDESSREKERKTKSSHKKHNRESSPYEKRSRRRSSSREIKTTKPKKERGCETLVKDESVKKTSKRNQNFPLKSRESDS